MLTNKSNFSFILFLLVFTLFISFSYAQVGKVEKKEQQTTSLKTADSDVVEVSVVGKNICLGCTLKMEKGAAANCKVYGHRHTLKVEKAYDSNGNEIPEMEGWVLHYLENENSKDYIDAHHNEELKLRGKVYKNERTLEVNKG